ncbi:hypothetical protein PUN28_016748 [Cardiocondyla obscurior]|uniref:Uncharacterized protein n=1 Tax=Cardiocondyla obscurior TaxID=286306 RepID=A0AAW2ETX4_9HYME
MFLFFPYYAARGVIAHLRACRHFPRKFHRANSARVWR